MYVHVQKEWRLADVLHYGSVVLKGKTMASVGVREVWGGGAV